MTTTPQTITIDLTSPAAKTPEGQAAIKAALDAQTTSRTDAVCALDELMRSVSRDQLADLISRATDDPEAGPDLVERLEAAMAEVKLTDENFLRSLNGQPPLAAWGNGRPRQRAGTLARKA